VTRLRPLQPYFVAVFFIVAGALHFVYPHAYEQIVPPVLPAHRALVFISGAFEVLGGLGTLLPTTRKVAAWGLIALLIAVFPANIYMALNAGAFASMLPAWALFARLPLQLVIIWCVWFACISE
jgi:uncharacterized membrane protein